MQRLFLIHVKNRNMKKTILLFLALITLSYHASAQFYEWGERLPDTTFTDSTGTKYISGGDWYLKNTFKVLKIKTFKYLKTFKCKRDTVFLIHVRCVDTSLYNACERKYGRRSAESNAEMTIVSFPSDKACNGSSLEVGKTYNMCIWLWYKYPFVGHGRDYWDVEGVPIPSKKLKSQPLWVKELHGLCLEQ